MVETTTTQRSSKHGTATTSPPRRRRGLVAIGTFCFIVGLFLCIVNIRHATIHTVIEHDLSILQNILDESFLSMTGNDDEENLSSSSSRATRPRARSRRHFRSSRLHARRQAERTERRRRRQRRREQTPSHQDDSSSMTTTPASAVAKEDKHPCKSVFFWGGGKAGSTTLAMLLKHDSTDTQQWDPNGQFIDLGKEVCWAIKGGHARWLDLIHGKCNPQQKQTFALDGCPSYRTRAAAETILNAYPDAKFLMLVRDPVDRMVSHLNDRHARRGGRMIPEGTVERHAKRIVSEDAKRGPLVELSQYGQNLQVLLSVIKDPRQVLIIQTEAMKRDAQQVMDDVMDHIGGQRKRVVAIHANRLSNHHGGRQSSLKTQSSFAFEYQTISNETRADLQKYLMDDVELLESLVGRRFPWSWTNTNNNAEEATTSWHTTYPRGTIETANDPIGGKE